MGNYVRNWSMHNMVLWVLPVTIRHYTELFWHFWCEIVLTAPFPVTSPNYELLLLCASGRQQRGLRLDRKTYPNERNLQLIRRLWQNPRPVCAHRL